MAVGTYGSVKLADVDFNAVDVLYSYSPDRESLGDVEFQPIYNSVTNNEFRKMIGADGGYKLRLPASIFNRLGFYLINTIVFCDVVATMTDTQFFCSHKPTSPDKELQEHHDG